MMPSITSTLTTTLTIFVTISSALQPDAYPPAITGLSKCTQGVVYDCLAGSRCNPSSFPCICNELIRLNAHRILELACPSSDVIQYKTFESNACFLNVQQIHVPPANVTTPKPVPPVVPLSTGPASKPQNVTVTTTKPVGGTGTGTGTGGSGGGGGGGGAGGGGGGGGAGGAGGTGGTGTGTGQGAGQGSGQQGAGTGAGSGQGAGQGAGPGAGQGAGQGAGGGAGKGDATTTRTALSLTTATYVEATTLINGQATSVTREVVGPAGPTTAAGPAFTGAAVAVDVPEFGSVRIGLMAGGIGLMGLMFAEW